MRIAELPRLLELLPRIVRKDPIPVDAVVLTNETGAPQRVSTTGSVLSFQRADIADAPVRAFALRFRAEDQVPLFTLDEVRLAMPGVGFAATLPDPAAAAVQASTLLEEPAIEVPIDGTITLRRWTSATWRLLDPFARALEAAAERLDAALGQLNLLTAADAFADYWGTLTGTRRRPGEDDDGYTARQLHEILRPRENNQALAVLLEEEHGVPVADVRDLRRDIFRCSATPLRGFRLAGERYNACTAEVLFAGIAPIGAVETARANVAAGITVLLVDQLDGRDAPAAYYLDGTEYIIGAPTPMQIGVGTIGLDQIGS